MAQLNLAECLSSLQCSIDFEFASTDLIPECVAGLERLADLLLRHASLEVLVEGHAQPGAPPTLARLLSRGRALAVCRVLMRRGVEASRLKEMVRKESTTRSTASSLPPEADWALGNR